MAESLEIQTMTAFIEAGGFRQTSGSRPKGTLTAAGYLSNHQKDGTAGRGLAIDGAGRRACRDCPELAALFQWIDTNYRSITAELIYAGPQVSYNIKNGRVVGKYAQAGHHDHVHWAIYKGAHTKIRIPGGVPKGAAPMAHSIESIGADIAFLKSAMLPDLHNKQLARHDKTQEALNFMKDVQAGDLFNKQWQHLHDLETRIMAKLEEIEGKLG